ncbi:hypothetical protein BHE74_00019800 [Ensete ventricosum]|nr:hypothetical protein BHE74_00019800 [Ensete ventricosum]
MDVCSHASYGSSLLRLRQWLGGRSPPLRRHHGISFRITSTSGEFFAVFLLYRILSSTWCVCPEIPVVYECLKHTQKGL